MASIELSVRSLSLHTCRVLELLTLGSLKICKLSRQREMSIKYGNSAPETVSPVDSGWKNKLHRTKMYRYPLISGLWLRCLFHIVLFDSICDGMFCYYDFYSMSSPLPAVTLFRVVRLGLQPDSQMFSCSYSNNRLKKPDRRSTPTKSVANKICFAAKRLSVNVTSSK